ncbi:hypothetical protein Slin15195_G023060 [Septoria linicola]|uniref:Uncharacterized protein n=1 Tax=Septoria linicola TaxID=215465 RepID=A0A9Q9AMZ6_9PEZI|nr:hypothetical protein Slin15195_G023060 [Septoria linicola]
MAASCVAGYEFGKRGASSLGVNITDAVDASSITSEIGSSQATSAYRICVAPTRKVLHHFKTFAHAAGYTETGGILVDTRLNAIHAPCPLQRTQYSHQC